MQIQRSTLPVLVVAVVASIGLAACSGQPDNQAAPAAATTSSSTLPSDANHPDRTGNVAGPAMAATAPDRGGDTTTDAAANPQYLYDLQRQPDFARAFTAMAGAKDLPGWVRQGGTATPATRVQLDGKSWLAAQACKPHACPSEQVVLLYDRPANTMQGVFVRDPAPGADAGISSEAKLTWLGDPDSTVKAWLTQRLQSPE